MTPKEFLEEGERLGLDVRAIKKEVPVGSGRYMLLGFERSKRSRKYREKFLLEKPIWMDELAKGPITHGNTAAPTEVPGN